MLALSLVYLLLTASVNGQDAQAPIPFETVATSGNATGCQQACSQLQATFDVAEFTKQYFVIQQQEIKPTCVIQPESAAHISRIVQVVKEQSCQFAVRSGGHGNHVGVSSVQDGLVIDLSRLNSVTVSEDESIAMIGAGSRWIDVYPVLEEKGLLVVGGRVATVGVGGFTLGGGISFLSRRYGWAVDNVRNYQVVLANGTIANVNRNTFPDLFFALRGGGNNFGIVVRFDFETHRQGPMLGGSTVFALEDLEPRRAALGLRDQWQWTMSSFLGQASKYLFKVINGLGFGTHSRDIIREFVALADESQTDAGAHAYMFFSWMPTYHSYFLGLTRMYSAPGAAPDPNPAVFQNIGSLKKIHSTVRVSNMSDFAREMDTQCKQLEARRNIWRTVTVKVNQDLISDILDVILSHIQPYKSIPGALISFNLQLLTKHEIELFAKDGGNALGVHPDEGPLLLFSLTFGYDDASDDEKFNALADSIMREAISLAKERGLYHPFLYQNYAGAGQDVYAGYGAQNRAKLSDIQKKYDPEGVFWKLQPGYYKV